jgi:hypothetical protein
MFGYLPPQFIADRPFRLPCPIVEHDDDPSGRCHVPVVSPDLTEELDGGVAQRADARGDLDRLQPQLQPEVALRVGDDEADVGGT